MEKEGKINSGDLCNLLYDILLFIYLYGRMRMIEYEWEREKQNG